jgi:peptide deformylase
MGIRALIQLTETELPDSAALRRPTRPVDEFGERLQEVVTDLIDTLHAHRVAVGLAAPQIGVDLSVAVIQLGRGEAAELLVICNPVIETATGKKDKKIESCMSLPGYGGEVERREKVKFRYQTAHGIWETREAKGFLARVVAHEIDHLNGILYVDRMRDPLTLRRVDVFERD